MNKKYRYTNKISDNLRRTLKNKIIASLLIFMGWISTLVDCEGGYFVFTLLIGLPIFFSKKDMFQ